MMVKNELTSGDKDTITRKNIAERQSRRKKLQSTQTIWTFLSP